MSEEIEVLKIVTGRLERAGLGYMVTGSMALNYYALPRMTRDIDLVVELSPHDADRIVDLFGGDFYVDGEAVRLAIERRGALNAIEMTPRGKTAFALRHGSAVPPPGVARERAITADGHHPV